MPDGSPIDQWWKSHRPVQVTTTATNRVCMIRVMERRSWCGRKPQRGHQTANWDDVTCSDCRAALSADTKPSDPSTKENDRDR